MKKRGIVESGRKRMKTGHIITILVIVLALIIFLITLSSSKTSAFGANTAVIKIENVILISKSGFMPYPAIYADNIIKDINDATANPNIKAIIFEINSPGGSAVASNEIADAVKKAGQANKTTIALIKEQGTSGAYWIASACEHVIAHPLSFTGSIGVIGSYLEFSGLLENYNVTYERFVSGKYKDAMSPFRELNDEERAMIQKKLDIVHETFIEAVAKNRNLSVDEVRGLANGMFYIGKEAKEFGLVDELGSKKDAIKYIETKHNINVKIKEYKKEKGFFEKFLKIQSSNSFWMGRGIGASMVDRNLLTSLNSISLRT